MNLPIESFVGEYRWLSNFYPARVEFEGAVYSCAENAYQAAKFPPHQRIDFLQCHPAAAKKMGRGAKIAAEDWNARRLGIMRVLLAEKFKPGSALALKLLATGDALLIEGNHWGDTFWGVCNGRGENHLGKLLMERRGELRR